MQCGSDDWNRTCLATAPAPALSIVREYKTDGPVTKTLIPMAALDDMVGCAVFFSVIAVVAGNLSAGQMPAYMVPLIVLLPSQAPLTAVTSKIRKKPESAACCTDFPLM